VKCQFHYHLTLQKLSELLREHTKQTMYVEWQTFRQIRSDTQDISLSGTSIKKEDIYSIL
jgi:hypothetical protein